MAHPLNKPNILNEELIKKLSDAIRSVLVMRRACDLIGLNRQNLDNWRKKSDELPDSIYAMLFIEIRKAQAEKIQTLLANIEERKSNWQANAWILERCFREDFGQDAGIIEELVSRANQMDDLIENIKLGRELFNDKKVDTANNQG